MRTRFLVHRWLPIPGPHTGEGPGGSLGPRKDTNLVRGGKALMSKSPPQGPPADNRRLGGQDSRMTETRGQARPFCWVLGVM